MLTSQLNYNLNDKLFNLFQVIGLGSQDNFSISTNKKNGLTAWITGPYIILYDIKKDKQIKFIKNKNNKIFKCLCFNEEGNILASGEGNCKSSEIVLYEIPNDIANSEIKIKTSFKAHKFGIEKLKFFKNDNFLMSIGDKQDKSMYIFNLNNNDTIFSSKYNRAILCFDICENFLVLGGVQFFKLWNFENLDDLGNKKLIINKFNVDTGKLKEKVFTSCVIYTQNNEKRVLILSSDGHLAEMKYSSKQLCRWVHLKTDKGITMSINDNTLFLGCGDGVIRLFKADTLEHVVTLHRPPPLGKANIDANIKKINISVTNDEKFADVVCLCFNKFYDKLITIYSDKTFFVWDLKKSEKIYVDRYNAFHSGSINFMDIQETNDNILRILTCSDDKTVKYWNLKYEDFLSSEELPNQHVTNNFLGGNKKLAHIAYSKLIRRIFYFGKNLNHLKYDMESIIQGGATDKYSDNIGENYLDDNDIEISTVKFSPDGKFAAFGDIFGNLYIYNLTTFEQINFASAHNAQISTIDFITSITPKNNYYLATGSCDTFINVFDVTSGLDKDFETFERTVLCDHQAPVTNVQFLIDKFEQTKLVSCSADRSICFYLVKSASDVVLTQKFQENDISTYCLGLNPLNNSIIAGHNGRVTIWKTKMCVIDKIFKMKRGENLLDNFRIAVDKTGTIMAISNNDKYIRIRSIQDGQLITKIPIAESVSSIYFSLNNTYLIASSVEGYIYFFKMDKEELKLKMPTTSPEKNKMKNKLKILEKFMQNDVNFSKNERVKALIDKMKNSEDVKYEDLKVLEKNILENNEIRDSLFGNNKNMNDEKLEPLNILENNNKNDTEIATETDLIKFVNKIEFLTKNNEEVDVQKSPIIELKEEKAVNDEEEDKSEVNKIYLNNRSSIFEKNLKEITPDAMRKSILNKEFTRVSLTDTYYKKKNTGVNEGRKDIMHIPRIPVVENIVKEVKELKKEQHVTFTKEVFKDVKEIKEVKDKDDIIIGKLKNKIKIISNNEKDNKIKDNKDNNPVEKTEKVESTQSIQSIPVVTVQKFDENKKPTEVPKIIEENKVSKANSTKDIPELEIISKSTKNPSAIDTSTISELQQLIMDTNKYVDIVETNIINNDQIKLSVKKEKEKEDDYNHFTNEDRLSYANGFIPYSNQKGFNIFKKNLNNEDGGFNEEKISIEPKYNNVSNSTNLKQEEIIEDLTLPTALKLTDKDENETILQTHNLDVDDTVVNRDKIQLNEVNNINSLIYSQSQSHFIDETQVMGTTNFDISNITEINDKSNININSTLLEINKNSNSKKTIPNLAINYNRKDCVTEKFSFSYLKDKPADSNADALSKMLKQFDVKTVNKEDKVKLESLCR